MTYQFDADIAAKFGVDEAVFIAMLQFWIAKNEANDRHFHDGRYWTYNSLRAMEKLFPFWTKRQIERIVKKLRDKGVVLTSNYSKASNDRTLFYSLDESKLPISPFACEVSPNGEMINEQLYTQLEEEEKKGNSGQAAVDAYNAVCTDLPVCRKLTDRRKTAVVRLLKKGYSVDELKAAFAKANASPFCRGQNDRHWRADFDWLMNENNLVKVLEGKYDDVRGADSPHTGGGAYPEW